MVTLEGAPPRPAGSALNASLTCLGWLQKLGCVSSGLQTPLATAQSPICNPFRTKDKPAKKPTSKSSKSSKPAKKGSANSKQDASAKEKSPKSCTLRLIDYSTSPNEKPPYCYATLIYMAIKASKKEKITLGEIYSYVRTNFMYYRVTDNGWRNSIRHNLTQHKCFAKVQRTEEHPGKGGYWQLSIGYESMFKDGVFKRKRRKMSASHNVQKTGKPAGKSAGTGGATPKIRSKKKKERNSKTGLLGNLLEANALDFSSVDEAEVGMFDGIDWESWHSSPMSDVPSHLGQEESESSGASTMSDLGDADTMISALSIMDAAAASPISILPDINQNDGSAQSPADFSLTDLQMAPLTKSFKSGQSISEQLRDCESKIDLDATGSPSQLSDSDDTAWSGEDLMVVGVSLNLTDGIVPSMPITDYHHITPKDIKTDFNDMDGFGPGDLKTDVDDLDDLDSAPIPDDWNVLG